MIGYPALLQIKPSAKADRHGIFANLLDTQAVAFLKPDKTLRSAIVPLFKGADMKYSETGLRYLAKPEPVYEEIAPGAGGAAAQHVDESEDFDEIPF